MDSSQGRAKQKQEKVVGASLLSTQYNGAMYRDWWVWNQDNASELSDMDYIGMCIVNE
jgi:hypothetical protein